jgi:hypothetical protein
MRFFELYRTEDESGISGTGIVAEGVVFWNGKCALAWKTQYTSVAIYDDIATLEKIHGHDGKTRVVFRSEGDMSALCSVCGGSGYIAPSDSVSGREVTPCPECRG